MYYPRNIRIFDETEYKRYQTIIVMITSSLDTQKFSEMIKSKRGKKGLRQLASEIGISASTLSRIEQGNLPDIDTYIKLCEWLEVSTEYFTSNNTERNAKSDIIAYLRADKTLPQSTSDALIQMIQLAYASATKDTKI